MDMVTDTRDDFQIQDGHQVGDSVRQLRGQKWTMNRLNGGLRKDLISLKVTVRLE